ncbi:MAG: hypothetical protein IJQ36_08240 [Oscillospiraceae bacterium]|nr:hypothetical protein [Oscillospiraceae bacterium]
MKRELLSEALGDIDDRFIAEAYRPARPAADDTERSMRVRKKRFITLGLVAAVLMTLSVAAYAINQAVGTPQAAQRVALQEIERWKELGLLNQEVQFEGDADKIVEINEHKGSESWYGRLFPHSYDVRWYLGAGGAYQTPPADAAPRKFGCNLTIDTLTGKMMAANIDARAAEDAVPVREGSWESPADPSDPEGEWVEMPIYFYDNYTDIFPADMTVGHFCELLAKYWGFSGYRLAETVDDMYFDEPQAPVAPDTLLKDLAENTKPNYYLTVFFDGDQEGAPMYIQLHQFPGYVTLTVGTGHAVG